MKNILNPKALITADDWGISPGVNEGILNLAKKKIIQRISCMAYGRYLGHQLDELLSLKGIELGLHFDLTFNKTRSQIQSLIFHSILFPKRIKPLVFREFREQWSKLQTLGIRPTYLDGHHHIHLLPGVLNVILEETKFMETQFVRTLCDRSLIFSTKFPLVLLSLLAKPKIRGHGLATLPCWYPNLKLKDSIQFKNELQLLQVKTEVIVHPALRNDFESLCIADSYSEDRVLEYKVLQRLI